MKYYDGLYFPMSGFWTGTDAKKRTRAFYYGLQFVSSGEIRLTLGGKIFSAHGPVAFLTCPEQACEYDTPPPGTRDHYWVCFMGTRVGHYLAGGLFFPDGGRPFFRPPDPGEWERKFNRLLELIRSGSDHDLAVFLLESLLFEFRHEQLSRSCLDEGEPARSFRVLADKMRSCPEHDWDFDAEARRLFLSRNHFNRLFRKHCGDSPRQFVIKSRLAVAARLLAGGTRPIADIAGSVGIDNEFYFSRLFKQKYRLSPLRYRMEQFTP